MSSFFYIIPQTPVVFGNPPRAIQPASFQAWLLAPTAQGGGVTRVAIQHKNFFLVLIPFWF
jgi:hypothetical protein